MYPLDLNIKCRMINFCLKLITGKNSKLSYLMYCCLLQLDQRGIYSSPWLTYIRNVCNECGMSNVWLSENVVNPTWFKRAIEQRLKDQWITSWNANLVSKSICSSYKFYKDIYCFEHYLVNLTKANRISLTKLRASNNRLPIITGRYNNISKEDRVCNKCNSGLLGDEYHVLFICDNEEIVRLRNNYIPRYYRARPNQFKYISMMQSTKVTVLNNVALFAKNVFDLFR